MIDTELGDLRRTHYSTELDSSKENSDVTVMGWIVSVRGHGNISFLTLCDKYGELQVVAKKGSCPDEILEKISHLKPHPSVAVAIIFGVLISVNCFSKK